MIYFSQNLSNKCIQARFNKKTLVWTVYFRLSESQDGSVIAKDVAVKKLDEKYESDIDIHDDSDW